MCGGYEDIACVHINYMYAKLIHVHHGININEYAVDLYIVQDFIKQ
jgi:hypothetical protein